LNKLQEKKTRKLNNEKRFIEQSDIKAFMCFEASYLTNTSFAESDKKILTKAIMTIKSKIKQQKQLTEQEEKIIKLCNQVNKLDERLDEQELLLYYANKITKSIVVANIDKMVRSLRDKEISLSEEELLDWLMSKGIFKSDGTPHQKYVGMSLFEVQYNE